MKRVIVFGLVLIFGALQVAAVQAGNPKGKGANSSNKQDTAAQQQTSATPIVIVLSGAQLNGGANGGQSGNSYSPPYQTTGVNLGQGQGSIDPGYFGGTQNQQPITITHGGNPPRSPSSGGFTITHGGNPPRSVRQPTNYCNSNNYNKCYRYDYSNRVWYVPYYYSNGYYYDNSCNNNGYYYDGYYYDSSYSDGYYDGGSYDSGSYDNGSYDSGFDSYDSYGGDSFDGGDGDW